MRNLDAIMEEIETELDEKDAVRELALKSSRAITRLAGRALRGLYRSENPTEPLNDAKEEASKLRALLAEHMDLFHSGFVENAFQELCEACITISLVNGEDLPRPRELGVTNSSYILGLGDSVGELRRFALEALRSGKIDEAVSYLGMMEEIYSALMRFDYPTALVAIKRKQDIARSLLERTRGEIAVASRGRQLEKKIEELEKKL